MFAQLNLIEQRFEDLSRQLQESVVINDQPKYKAYMKEYASLEETVKCYRHFKRLKQNYESNQEMLQSEPDEELKSMAKAENQDISKQLEDLEQQLKIMILPKDPNDDKNIVLEIRPAAGGDEAALFAGELFRGYELYAAKQGWSVEVLTLTAATLGGLKEVVANISGDKVYSKLKYESGVHRVQRVPKTEAQGRVHTSTVTVAVLPEAEEVDVKLNMSDVRVDVFRSGGSGGQGVNTTDSAVRLTHIPTGLVVVCQDERSQLKNKNKAMKILLARMMNQQKEVNIKEASDSRLAQIGTGDRSERIRTYNFPQTRLSDHRIEFTTHQLNSVMAGDFNLVIEPLISHYQTEALKSQKI
jgi:peptide chain release factor 1